ncbi:glycoside hydrolase family 3 protein, partial [Microvirga sp. 3-52]|nr:glycoside hydrolase family 3 protein [Microvirga sp. 3-52]
MTFFRKGPFILVMIFALLMSSISLMGNVVKAQANDNIKDLIIFQNIPESTIEVENNQIELKAVHLYDDGHFTKTSENLTWHSKNKNVASVNENGVVTFTGQNGRSFITVTDGNFRDEIAVHHKANKPIKQQVIREKGDRYNVIDRAINGMTLNEKIGQMLMPDFRNWKGQNVTKMLPEIEQLIQEYHLGGVILFRENVVTTEQTARLVADYQEATEKYGLLMTIDQEGGIVTRLQSGTDMPGNMALGATRSPEIAHDVGRVIGEELNALGINMNLAPVLDVNNNSDNPVIGVRSIGESPDLVAEIGVAYTKGLQST